MKTLFVFNHPAPYKVSVFNELFKYTDIKVVFERKSAKDRPASFYSQNEYHFPHVFLKRGAFSKENTFTGELKKYIKKNYQKFDHIIMNGYSTIAEMRAIKYMIKHHIPYTLQINGGIIKNDKKWKYKLKKYYISHADKWLSPCYEADLYLCHYGAIKEKIDHYPYGNYFDNDVIDQPLSKEDKNEIRKKWQLPEGKIFVNASQFIERKNNMQLISIFKNREEKLLLIGSGNEKEKYIKFINENKIQNILIFNYLSKKDLFEVLKSADYFITLSEEDIFGHTTLEALANGLPVISSDRVISSKDIIQNGVNGYLVDIKNENQIIEAINNADKLNPLEAIKTAKNNTIENSARVLFEIINKEQR